MTGLPPDIQAAIDRMEPVAFKAFMDALAQVTSAAQMQTIIGHLQAGNIEAAVMALRLDQAFFAPLDRAISEAHYQGGVMALAALPRLKDPFPVARSCSGSTPDTSGPKPGSEPNPQG